MEQAVEAAIQSMHGLQGRDQRLKEWRSKAYSLGHADARALSVRLLGGKQVQYVYHTGSCFYFTGEPLFICQKSFSVSPQLVFVLHTSLFLLLLLLFALLLSIGESKLL